MRPEQPLEKPKKIGTQYQPSPAHISPHQPSLFDRNSQIRAAVKQQQADQVTYGLGIPQDKISRASYKVGRTKQDVSRMGPQHMQEKNSELRPKSASFNCFGPKKNQHLSKAKSLLSTAASNARFSHGSVPRRNIVAAKHLGSHTDML